jgi:two-component system CheB/CheR fusion protein
MRSTNLAAIHCRSVIGGGICSANLVKHTQSGSVQMRVRSDADGDPLYIDIIDTGPGIPPERLERLFEAFYQIDNPNRDQRQGVGLGLSIVQTICRLLDHTMTIESRLGAGSTFTVQLPRGLVSEAQRLPVPNVLPTAAASPTRIKVLHVEDDPGVARSTAMLLRLEGYDVTSCGRGLETA